MLRGRTTGPVAWLRFAGRDPLVDFGEGREDEPPLVVVGVPVRVRSARAKMRNCSKLHRSGKPATVHHQGSAGDE